MPKKETTEEKYQRVSGDFPPKLHKHKKGMDRGYKETPSDQGRYDIVAMASALASEHLKLHTITTGGDKARSRRTKHFDARDAVLRALAYQKHGETINNGAKRSDLGNWLKRDLDGFVDALDAAQAIKKDAPDLSDFAIEHEDHIRALAKLKSLRPVLDKLQIGCVRHRN